MTFKFALPALALAAAGLAAPAVAAIPVYSPYGVENADTYDLTLASNTSLSFYYLGSVTAGYSGIFSYSVNGGAFVNVLTTNTATVGGLYNLGNFNAGDTFEFRLTLTKPAGVAGNVLSSDPSQNEGGAQQIWMSSYGGGDLGVPVGSYTYMAFEDVLNGADALRPSDYDYNDRRFAFFGSSPRVFQDVVPEPATWAMLISGFGMVGFAMRRRRSSISVVAA